MKTLKMKCEICGKVETLSGRDSADIIKKIDDSGWEDYPTDETLSDISFLCPDCKKED